MTEFTPTLRTVGRVLRRNRLLALTVVATLATAIGATVSTFSLVAAALITPAPFPEPQRLAILFTTHTEPGRATEQYRWSYTRFRLLQRALTTTSSIGCYGLASVNLSGTVEAEPVSAEPVGGDYFTTLGTRPALGRSFSSAEDLSPSEAMVVVLSDALWRRRYAADRAVLGKAIRINGRELTVIGVMPPGFEGLSGRAELWFPAVQAPRLTYPAFLTTNQNFISVVGRLAPNVSMASLQAEIATVGDAIQREAPSESEMPGDRFGATAVALDDLRINATTRRAMLVLLGAVGVVLLLACANISSLLITHAASRRREMAVRLALGATRGRLARLLLLEVSVLSALGGALGLLVAWGMTHWIVAPASPIAPSNFYGSIGELARPRMDPLLIAVAVGVTIASAILCGLVPALTATRMGVATTLRQSGAVAQGGGSAARWSARGLTVALELALALVLLSGGSLMLATLDRLSGESLGIDPRNVITFAIRPPEAMYSTDRAPMFIERLLRELTEVPGVTAATVDGCAPLTTSCANSSLHIVGRQQPAPGEAPFIRRHYVAPDHFRVLGIPVLRGRALETSDREGHPPVAVINETAARRFWPNENPIGARIWFGGGSRWMSPDSSLEIVGVVGDMPYQEGESRRMLPAFYTSYLQFTYAARTVMVRTDGRNAVAMRGIRDAMRRVDPDLAIYDLGLLTQQLGNAWAKQRFVSNVLAAFAALALLLAATGVFGVVAGLVSERTREIGIRMALGATPGEVGRLMVRQGMRLPLLGIALGAVLAIPAAQTLRGLVYGVSPRDPRVFITVVLGLGVVALVATIIPARRATRVDPRIAMGAD